MIYHLGPAGRMFALREVERDVEPSVASAAPGGSFTSLTGRRSRDRTGPYRRTWQLAWPYRERADFDLVDALRRGHLGWPLRLIDPNLPNLLGAQIATGGTELRSVSGWSTAVGAIRWVRPADVPADHLAVGAIEWTAPTAQDDLTTGRETSSHRLPAPPGGGPVCVAARIARVDAPAAASFIPLVDTWNAAGTRTTLVSSTRSVPGTWGDVEVSTTLAPTVAEWAPAWRSPAGIGATFRLAGVRAGHGRSAPAPDRGGGSAEVMVTDLSLTNPSEGEFSYTLQIEEC